MPLTLGRKIYTLESTLDCLASTYVNGSKMAKSTNQLKNETLEVFMNFHEPIYFTANSVKVELLFVKSTVDQQT